MIFSIWLIFSLVVGYLATTKGRDPGRWFVLALIFSPLLAGIVLLITENITEQESLKDGINKKCYACAEIIKAEAFRCKHCGELQKIN